MDLTRAAILIGLCAAAALRAQDIRIYSEFERFDPFGNPVAADRDMAPREILSPAMPRNGHLSVHIVVSAPAETDYFLYTNSNPPGILDMRIYREFFTPCGEGYCPDWLAEQRLPAFGVVPERMHNDDPALDKQNTRCYLLDIRAPADVPPRRVRVEALLKVGTWYVAPMEVRITAPTVPDVPGDAGFREDIAPLDAPSSATAHRQLLRYLEGRPPEWPVQLLRVRDFIQRNAAEDMLLARSLEPGSSRRPFPELSLLSWWPLIYRNRLGAEWYLKVRDFLYRF